MVLRQRRRGRGHNRPRGAQARPAGAVVSETPRPAGPTQTRRKTVLVIEDNATVGGITVALLREEGYRALRAWDAREAVKVARDRKPDLILLDLSLPYPTGLPTLQELREHAETKEAPIILATGNVFQFGPGERELVAQHVSRPIDMDLFINHVRKALGDPELEVPEKDRSSNVDGNFPTW